MMTKRGKRTHLINEKVEILEALCGAGQPNKEFPFGSGVPLTDKLPQRSLTREEQLGGEEAQVTCYKCLKIHAMETIAQSKNESGQKMSLQMRDFFPTHEGNRFEHFMLPGGRKGPFVTGLDDYGIEIGDRRISGYEDYFTEQSKWHPGPSTKRTQPKAIWEQDDLNAELLAQLKDFDLNEKTFYDLVRYSIDGGYIDDDGKIVYTRDIYSKLDPTRDPRKSYGTVIAKIDSLVKLRAQAAKARGQSAKERKSNPFMEIDVDTMNAFEDFIHAGRKHVQKRR